MCMRCFPFAEGNEHSQNIQNGTMLAAQLAAGLDPASEEGMASFEALLKPRMKIQGSGTRADSPMTSLGLSPASTTMLTGASSSVPDIPGQRPHSEGFQPSGFAGPRALDVSSSFRADDRFRDQALSSYFGQALTLGSSETNQASWRAHDLGGATQQQPREQGYQDFQHHSVGSHFTSTLSRVPTGSGIEKGSQLLSRDIWSSSPSRPVVIRPDDREDVKITGKKPKPIGTKDSSVPSAPSDRAATVDEHGKGG